MLALLIAIVFLTTAATLAWSSLSRCEQQTSYQPLDYDFTVPAEVRAGQAPILYYGSENCKECHSKREYKKLWNDWTKGGHKDVECEACHGPAGDHAVLDVDPPPKMAVTAEMLAKPHVLCMGCHGETPGREISVCQIDTDKHLADWKVNKDEPKQYAEGRQCIGCHDAHRPVKK